MRALPSNDRTQSTMALVAKLNQKERHFKPYQAHLHPRLALLNLWGHGSPSSCTLRTSSILSILSILSTSLNTLSSSCGGKGTAGTKLPMLAQHKRNALPLDLAEERARSV